MNCYWHHYCKQRIWPSPQNVNIGQCGGKIGKVELKLKKKEVTWCPKWPNHVIKKKTVNLLHLYMSCVDGAYNRQFTHNMALKYHTTNESLI
jgi:hypothetical protein